MPKQQTEYVPLCSFEVGGEWGYGYRDDDELDVQITTIQSNAFTGTYDKVYELCVAHLNAHDGIYIGNGMFPCPIVLLRDVADMYLHIKPELRTCLEYAFLARYAHNIIEIGDHYFYRPKGIGQFRQWPSHLSFLIGSLGGEGNGGQDMLVKFPSQVHDECTVEGTIIVEEADFHDEVLEGYCIAFRELGKVLTRSFFGIQNPDFLTADSFVNIYCDASQVVGIDMDEFQRELSEFLSHWGMSPIDIDYDVIQDVKPVPQTLHHGEELIGYVIDPPEAVQQDQQASPCTTETYMVGDITILCPYCQEIHKPDSMRHPITCQKCGQQFHIIQCDSCKNYIGAVDDQDKNECPLCHCEHSVMGREEFEQNTVFVTCPECQSCDVPVKRPTEYKPQFYQATCPSCNLVFYVGACESCKEVIAVKVADYGNECPLCHGWRVNDDTTCSYCGKPFKAEVERIETCDQSGAVVLCRPCYNKAGNSVR